MGKVVLARVDARLIHGQVMTSLSKSAGATAIFVADDPAAHDPFTKNIILGAGSRTGLKVRVLKEDGAVRYWNDRQYDDYHSADQEHRGDGRYHTGRSADERAESWRYSTEAGTDLNH